MRTGNLTPSASGYVNVGTEATAYASGVFDNIRANTIYASGVKLTGTSRMILWYIPGAIAVGTDASAYVDMSFSGTIVAAHARAKTGPTGRSMEIDINKNGASIFGTVLTIADGQTIGTAVPSTTTFVDGDYFTIDIDNVGSGDAGENLTVKLEVTG